MSGICLIVKKTALKLFKRRGNKLEEVRALFAVVSVGSILPLGSAITVPPLISILVFLFSVEKIHPAYAS
jgi:hypothetical protein